MSVQQQEKQEVQRVFACLKCGLEYNNASSARYHMREKENITITNISLGKRQQEYKFVNPCPTKKYACCKCFSLLPTKDLFRAHYQYEHEPGQQSAEEQSSHPFSSPLKPIENTVVVPRKRRKTTNEAIKQLLGNEKHFSEILSAIVKTSKLATSWINIGSEEDNEDVYLISSPKQLLKVKKFGDDLVKVKTGTCVATESPSPVPNMEALPDDYLHQTLYRSEPYSFMMDLDKYTEISGSERDILNKDWLSGKELRLACGQLLGGAVLVDGSQILFINTVEVYARSSYIDAHHERLNPVVTFSSIPTPAHHYKNLSILKYENDNSDKLIIGTYSFNALVTSSLRLDVQSELETGPSTKMFTPSRDTKLHIAESSRNTANNIIELKKETLYDHDILHQLRQLRSKLCSPSTYSTSRACALITNNIACRPYTIFTVSDSGTNSLDTDDMIACLILRLIATKIMHNTNTLTKQEIDNMLESKKGNSVVIETVKSISSMIKENEPISIIHNNDLEILLVILANIITSKLPTYNEQVKIKFKQRMESLKNTRK